ncbi:hypothetical protein AAJ72_11100 [Citromicrobium sp. RCC1885]|uniref:type IV secretory system conjugative DNA transfer family protein n=1 Tax=unclassified Citromicrobium TaxID=2630544 RepID=UPI0006C92688|nr:MULTISPECIES: type IV secretory system conjugative DNA transfer family protein [unclassified Citromicrobium]KPM22441.1 hypothetical protein AAJ72_11100 [Citromicrobium sp. RCC1885]KPM25924.1 hypothetical protein AAJ74_11840 [Citromicrobium sp. RCC1878]MAO03162.1 hypothetical protein [Citromicrobium sp.]OAM08002.1 hypothetical protein A0U43_12330 [Citromicrobium sp. RCC1897]|tara:strand:- start:4374 stop:5975 length:1602 start_codon:yes stop_codon:yes gene_type:complete
MRPEDNSEFRFGSAAFADQHELAAAAMFRQGPDSLFLGFHNGKPIFYDGMGGLLLIAGARSGKLRDVLAYNLCGGFCAQSMVILDVKGELGAISRDLTPQRKFAAYWNPASLHGLPQNRINPVDYLRADSPSLVSDMKIFWENLIPHSGSPSALFFEDSARDKGEGLSLAVTDRDGVMTLPALYEVINLLLGGGDRWLEFAFLMSESRFPSVRRIEEEIAISRSDSSGGFRGIIGELLKSVACLSDPLLMASVSPPFDFSFAQLTASDQTWHVYLMPPVESVESWKSVLKMHFVAGMIYKLRSPQAPRQTWMLDEGPILGVMSALERLFSVGAGAGLRPWLIAQSREQLNRIGKDAANIITASAAVRQFFNARDIDTARLVSDMIGPETLGFDDTQAQTRARYARQRAISSLLDGGDPLQAGMDYAHHAQLETMPSYQQRSLRNPSEILSMPPDRQLIWVDGVAKPIWGERAPYYEQRFMAGRYHPNPYHPPADKVRVKTRLGHEWRRVMREPVPQEFAHYPQYADGYWSVVR